MTARPLHTLSPAAITTTGRDGEAPVQVVRTIAAIRGAVAGFRAEAARVALVPTMGALHAGHMALVARARAEVDRVVATIFVNPTQFGDPADLAAYPRTEAADLAMLAQAGVDAVFIPEAAEVYPDGDETIVETTRLANVLHGQVRPGHFRGVTTVVARLFNIVGPDVAVFGEKDFQQLQVIRRMVRDLNMPVEVLEVPTVRDPDGLALSSRNGYLSPDQRRTAPVLARTLDAAAARLQGGERDYRALEAWVARELEQAGFRPDYVSIRRQGDLAEPQTGDRLLILLAAAWLGEARLIDNQEVQLHDGC